jgi:hypothetical protein
VSVAYQFAQTSGEIRDVSAKTDVALQQFVPRCVFFATFPTLSAIRPQLFYSEKYRARVGYFFSMKKTAIVHRRYMSRVAKLTHWAKFVRSSRGSAMQVVANHAGQAALTDKAENFDPGFLPKSLTTQCQSLIESYHELHGYACLPDILWKARLGPFIETHQEFRQLLRKASTTRSAKKSNAGFVRIASTILSLEILASSFAGWSAIYPEEGLVALAILKRVSRSPHMPLMEFYLYPPKYISSTAIATLVPPHQPGGVELYRTSKPELSGEKQALNYINAIQQTPDGRRPHTAAVSPA